MHIVVCVKQVPDTEIVKIKDHVSGGRVHLEGVEWAASLLDEYAVEAALRLQEAHGGKVTLVTVGPDRALQVLKDMLALGADEGIHINDPALNDLDPYGAAKTLAAAIRKIGDVDIVWTGSKAVDYDHGLLPAYLAEELGWPHAHLVVKVDADPDAGQITVQQEIEGGKQVLELPMPAVLAAQEGLNPVRYASLKNIMAVKRKTILTWTADDLDLDPTALTEPKIELVRVELPPERPAGRILDGTPEEAAEELVRLLHQEAKVI